MRERSPKLLSEITFAYLNEARIKGDNLPLVISAKMGSDFCQTIRSENIYKKFFLDAMEVTDNAFDSENSFVFNEVKNRFKRVFLLVPLDYWIIG